MSFDKLTDALLETGKLSTQMRIANWDLLFMSGAEATLQKERVAELDRLARTAFMRLNIRSAAEQVVTAAHNHAKYEVLFADRIIKSFDHNACLPFAFLTERRRVAAEIRDCYNLARDQNKFQVFVPGLKTALQMETREGSMLQSAYPGLDAKDALLQTYQDGITWEEYRQIVTPLRRWLKQAVKKIGVAGNGAWNKKYPLAEAEQGAVFQLIAEMLLIDANQTRMRAYRQPLSVILGVNQTCLTFRVEPENFFTCFKSGTHEIGHIWEFLRRRPELVACTPTLFLKDSSTIETFPLLLEDVACASPAFTGWLHAQLTRFDTFKGMDAEQLWHVLHGVRFNPRKVWSTGMGRILHNLMGADIEEMLLTGSLKVEDVWEWYRAELVETYEVEVPDEVVNENLLAFNTWPGGCLGMQTNYPLGVIYAAMVHEVAMQNRFVRTGFSDGELMHYKTWLDRQTSDAWLMSGKKFIRDVADQDPSAAAWIRHAEMLVATAQPT